MEAWLAYLILGAIAGVLAGLLGIGGGLLIVPVLVWLYVQQGVDAAVITHLAIGTSLATIVPTAIASARAHHAHGAVRWDLVWRLAPGVVFGALAGATLAEFLSSDMLRRVFGAFEIALALYMFIGVRPKPQRPLPGATYLSAGGGVIGLVSALLGIGGGTLTVPYLVWFNVAVRQAIGTASAVGLPIALAGAAGFMIHGWQAQGLPAWSAGYVHGPALAGIAIASFLTAPMGARLTHRLPVPLVRRLFALLLMGLGVKMLV
ncbi:sulfite exporter TauE/SafE family protein [Thioalkalivibrio sulfidiphilus]|uniref:sulfite exporter TauE/SafE family protein n=1 Tax=Thioalkalivibrio sulfidiphilus TaxID=1033854 RepID=UPI000362561E|nr:sulfite exporter TauE/SafE family protein [Thioalkalivibrio sulfidiphilus]